MTMLAQALLVPRAPLLPLRPFRLRLRHRQLRLLHLPARLCLQLLLPLHLWLLLRPCGLEQLLLPRRLLQQLQLQPQQRLRSLRAQRRQLLRLHLRYLHLHLPRCFCRWFALCLARAAHPQ